MADQPKMFAGSREHLDETGLAYLPHMGVAFGIGTSLIRAGLACLIHGIVPGAFTDTASRTIRRLHESLGSRRHTAVPPVHQPAEAEA
jgi:hypothetical protein